MMDLRDVLSSTPILRQIYGAGAALFAGRLDFERERMHAAGDFFGQKAVDGPVTLDPALADEFGRNQLYAKMRFAALACAAGMTGVASMFMGFVDHLKEFGRKSGRELCLHAFADSSFSRAFHVDSSFAPPAAGVGVSRDLIVVASLPAPPHSIIFVMSWI